MTQGEKLGLLFMLLVILVYAAINASLAPKSNLFLLGMFVVGWGIFILSGK